MISIYEHRNEQFRRIEEFEKGAWIDITSPTNEETEEVREKASIPLDFLTDPLDVNERSRVEKENGNLLVIVRAPVANPESEDLQFTTFPIGVIFTSRLVITVCADKTDVIKEVREGRARDFSPGRKSRFLLHLFLKTSLNYLNHLKEINQKTSVVERELHKSMRNEELIKLLYIEKSLVYFTTSLKSNEFIMERLLRTDFIKLNKEDRNFLEDTIIENRQAIETANIYSNILSGMMDAFASVISNNLTVVMKFLTSITIILMIPTLVASIYGMNIHLPFQNSPYAFIITIGISLVLSVLGILIFIRRRWF